MSLLDSLKEEGIQESRAKALLAVLSDIVDEVRIKQLETLNVKAGDTVLVEAPRHESVLDFSMWVRKRLSERAGGDVDVVVLHPDFSLEVADVEKMARAGWIRQEHLTRAQAATAAAISVVEDIRKTIGADPSKQTMEVINDMINSSCHLVRENAQLWAKRDKLVSALEDLVELADPTNHQSSCECDPSVGYQCKACRDYPIINAARAAISAVKVKS